MDLKPARNQELTTLLPSHGLSEKIEFKNQASPGLVMVNASLLISKLNIYMDPPGTGQPHLGYKEVSVGR